MSVPVITVDGPSGAGKGTLCYRLARNLGWHMLDSGALYRVTAHAAIENGIPLDDEAAVADLARNLDLNFRAAADGLTEVRLDGKDISEAIRRDACSVAASRVAAMGQVRRTLLARQQRFEQPPGLVADGRDMGTVVFPAAALKIFLTASAEARARRRFEQLKGQGESVNLARLLETIEERDARDRSRADSPLVPAADAVVIDSTGLTVQTVLDRVLDEARQRALIA